MQEELSQTSDGETLLESVRSNDESDTEAFAHRFFFRQLLDLPGAVLLLDGDLGAGKTAFCRALGRLLGIDEPVNSPTFNLLHQHSGKKGVLCHYDLYRISEMELEELEFPDLWSDVADGRFTIHAIEWWRRAGSIHSRLPVFRIELEFHPPEEHRTIHLYRRNA